MRRRRTGIWPSLKAEFSPYVMHPSVVVRVLSSAITPISRSAFESTLCSTRSTKTRFASVGCCTRPATTSAISEAVRSQCPVHNNQLKYTCAFEEACRGVVARPLSRSQALLGINDHIPRGGAEIFKFDRAFSAARFDDGKFSIPLDLSP